MTQDNQHIDLWRLLSPVPEHIDWDDRTRSFRTINQDTDAFKRFARGRIIIGGEIKWSLHSRTATVQDAQADLIRTYPEDQYIWPNRRMTEQHSSEGEEHQDQEVLGHTFREQES